MTSLESFINEFQQKIRNAIYTEGDFAIVVNNKWFAKLKQAIRKNQKTFNLKHTTSKLLDKGFLRHELLSPSDYFLVPNEAWELLKSNFETEDPIKIPVVLNPITKNVEFLVIIPIFQIIYEGESKEIYFNYFKTFRELKQEISAIFSIKDIEKYQLKIDGIDAIPKDEQIIYEVNPIKDFQRITLINPQKVVADSKSISTPTQYSLFSKPGYVGFQNHAMTCFFNSIMQCLVQTPPLVDYLINNKILNDLNGTPDENEATKAFQQAVSRIWSSSSSYHTENLFSLVQSFKITGHTLFQQEDSHELLQKILETLMNAVNTGTKKNVTSDNGTDDKELFQKFFKDYREANKSPISDMFTNFTKSVITCKKCKKRSVKYEYGTTLLLSIIPPTSRMASFLYIKYGTFIPEVINVQLPIHGNSDTYTKLIQEAINTNSKLAFTQMNTFVSPSSIEFQYVYEIPENGTYSIIQSSRKTGQIFCAPILVETDNKTPEQIEDSVKKILNMIWMNQTDYNASIPESEIPKDRFDIEMPNSFAPDSDFEFATPLINVIVNLSEEDENNPNIKNITIPRPNSYPPPNPSLEDCLNANFSPETISDWHCPDCGGEECEKSLSLSYAPDILIFVFKRTQTELKEVTINGIKQKRSFSKKIDDTVNVPLKLELGWQQWAKDITPANYELYASSHHLGSAAGLGHYISIVEHKDDHQWYHASDEQLTPIPQISPSNFEKSYILFYKKV